jgi:hypothetical protein
LDEETGSGHFRFDLRGDDTIFFFWRDIAFYDFLGFIYFLGHIFYFGILQSQYTQHIAINFRHIANVDAYKTNISNIVAKSGAKHDGIY